ncbi:MAG TPA: ABC transporter permease [Chloroflexota bacterium]|nr:ABC transporter permease [Chloroflexota bacterium]
MTTQARTLRMAVAPTGWARLRRALGTFGDLFFIQFSSVRTAWQWIFLISSVLPLGLLFFLSIVAAGAHRGMIVYFITGNVVVALMMNPLFMLSGQLAWARQSKAFDFYAGLPISRTMVILAAISVSVLFSVPGTIFMLIAGMALFHLWIVPSPLIVLIVLLSPTALSGLGASIGILAPNQQVAGVIANLVMVIVMFLSPIYTPLSRLPGLLQVTSHLLPPTYAAAGLRETLGGHISGEFWLDVLILAVFSLASIYLVTARLDWRSR